MKLLTIRSYLFAILFFLSLSAFSSLTLNAAAVPSAPPARDHLTEQESGLVADTQELDKRTAVFIKIIERRFLVVNTPNATQSPKDEEKWGPLQTGTRAQLIEDISKIIDEAINNIESVSERDPSNPLLVKSLNKLADACKGFVNQLHPMKEKTQDDKEWRAMTKAMENAQEVIDAAQKLPPTKGKSS